MIQSTAPVFGLTGRDRFIYATCSNQIDTKSGLWRIDLGHRQEDDSFPYATDLNSTVTGVVNSVSVFGASGRMVFGVSNSGSYLEHATDLVANGYVRTGYIRFNTVEPKQFRYISVRVADSLGSVGIESHDRNGATASIATISGYDASDYDLGRSSADEYLAVKLTLNRHAIDATKSPTLQSW